VPRGIPKTPKDDSTAAGGQGHRTVAAPKDDTVIEATSQTVPIVVLDDGTVEFTLRNGTAYRVREPNARALLLLQAWLATHYEYNTDSIVLIKLVYESIVTPNRPATFELFFDTLAIEDIEVVASALATFRSVFDYIAKRAALAAKERKAALSESQ